MVTTEKQRLLDFVDLPAQRQFAEKNHVRRDIVADLGCLLKNGRPDKAKDRITGKGPAIQVMEHVVAIMRAGSTQIQMIRVKAHGLALLIDNHRLRIDQYDFRVAVKDSDAAFEQFGSGHIVMGRPI